MTTLDEVRGWIDVAERVVVLTGAGISTDSGIPDFRGPQGVWTKNPGAEKTATLQYYMADPEVRKQAWRNRLEPDGLPGGRDCPDRGGARCAHRHRQRRAHAL